VVADLRHVADHHGAGRRAGAETPLDGGLGLLVVGRGRGCPHRVALGAERRSGRPGLAEPRRELLQRGPRRPDQTAGPGMVAADLLRVHVDLDDLLRGLEWHRRQARADREDDVGAVEVEANGGAGPERGAERQVAGIADGALALRGHDDRGLEVLRDGE
jgi:hypothetical protein